MKRILSLFISILIIILATISSYAYTVTDYSMYTGNFKTVANSSGLFMLGFSGKELDIEKVAPNASGVTLTLGYTCAAASVFGGTAVALCNDLDNDQLVVYTYDINTDVLDSFAVNGASVRYDKGFYFDGRYLYLPNDRNGLVIDRYSTGGRLVSSYTFPNDITAIVCGYSSGFCAVSGNSLYKNNGDSYSTISGAAITAPASFCSEDILSDCRGRVYRVSGTSARLLFTADTGYDHCVGCVMGNEIYSCADGVIHRYDLSGKELSYFDLGSACSALYAYNGTIYAASDNAQVSAVKLTELIVTQNKTTEPPAANNKTISSKVYKIDNKNYYISGIASPATLSQFKSNMKYDGYKLTFYRNDKKQTTGLVGTAMTAVFEGDDSLIYELAVRGDITGEGNVNSRDVDELIDYLLDKLRFNGVYSIAADVSGDNKVDILDLAILCRMADE